VFTAARVCMCLLLTRVALTRVTLTRAQNHGNASNSLLQV
jgi:hypothetical protein